MKINPLPDGFKSAATREIFSENTCKDLTTDSILANMKKVEQFFDKCGYDQAITESQMYTKGVETDA